MRKAELGWKKSLALSAAVVLSACAGEPPHQVESPNAPELESDPTRTPARTAESSSIFARAIERAAALRGLWPLGEIHYRQVSRASLTERALATALRDAPEAWLDGQARLLIWLDLAPLDFDFFAAFETLSASRLAGFYDPKEDVLFVSQDLDPKTAEETLLHELVHALQDQHFDLERLLGSARTSDQLAAIQTLGEGDATSATQGFALEPSPERSGPLSLLQAASSEALSGSEKLPKNAAPQGVPEVVLRSVEALYRDGFEAVQQLRADGDWARVNTVWRAPPQSTRELLHPDELGSHSVVRLKPPPPPWKASSSVVYDDVIGEQGLGVVLEAWASLEVARAAATGWQADRVTLFRDGSNRAIVWQLRFDQPSDAEEAFRVFMSGVLRVESPGLGASASQAFCHERAARGPIAIERRGRDLVLVGSWATAGDPQGFKRCAPLRKWSRRVLESIGLSEP